MAKNIMLSTSDNPFNPITNFDEWLQYDEVKGYRCCSLVDRLAQTSEELSEADNDAILEEAIDRIVSTIPVREAENETIKYIKVVSETD